jgi:preprotein translocase subunit SecF
MKIGNMYESKHYRLYAILPIVLFLVSLYFIPHIQLDQSLRGGVSIQLQTNSIVNTQALASAINANITGAEASVTQSPGSITVSIAANESLDSADSQLLQLYALNGTYAQASALSVSYGSILKADPQNATAQNALAALQVNQSTELTKMNAIADQELALLQPLLKSPNSGYSDGIPAKATPSQIISIAQNAYSAAQSGYKNNIMSALSRNVDFSTYSYNDVTPTLGAFFLNQLMDIIIWAFIVVAIIVLVIFRNPAPAFTVVFGSASDIVVALGGMAVLGIPLGVASIGGLLMLIGYSMDTDILAAIRILRRTDETPAARAHESFLTGITLTTAAIITFSILLVVSYVVYIPTYFEISGVVLIGLVADIITTWMLNTPLLLWQKHRMEVHRT